MSRSILLPTLLLAGCLATPILGGEGVLEPGTVLTDEPGSIVHVGSDWWGIVPDVEPTTRLAPDELPPELREDGLRIVFSGTVGEIPPNVRLWGTPLELTAIRREGEEVDS